jgi:hypothetical protein
MITGNLPSQNTNETPGIAGFVGEIKRVEKSVSRSLSSVRIDRNRPETSVAFRSRSPDPIIHCPHL